MTDERMQAPAFTAVPSTDASVQETQFVSFNDESSSSQQKSARFTNNRSSTDHHGLQSGRAESNTYGTVAEVPPEPIEEPVEPVKPLKPARALAPDLVRGLLMVIQAIDHCAVTSGAWPHGTAIESEGDGIVVTRWNRPVAWVCRMLTHLCAPGFMFLLGMGVVYFGKSRRKLGWNAQRLVRHFFIRGLVLTVINMVLGVALAGGRLIILNMVLLALAVNYFLAGLLWLLSTWTEEGMTDVLTRRLGTSRHDDDEDSHARLSLLGHSTAHGNLQRTPSVQARERAIRISFHVHNIVYLVLAGLTLWWNIWLSEDHGRCSASSSEFDSPTHEKDNQFFAFFFYMVKTERVLSGFPPLAWLSFALVGSLYARIILYKQWPNKRVNLFNLLTGLLFVILFVLTRVFNFGNMSQDCLRMAHQLKHPGHNQYLLDFRSFFYVTKYPPDPAFAFYTLGALFLSLSAFGFVPAKWAPKIPFNILLTYGTCALFFYVVHLPLYGLLGAIAKRFWGFEGDWKDFTGNTAVAIPLSVFWVDWVVGLVMMWALCRWYGAFKARKSVDSLWRFF